MPINDFSFTPIMSGLLDAKANPIPSASLYSFTVLYKRYYNVEMPDGSMKVNATIENLKLEDCNKLKSLNMHKRKIDKENEDNNSKKLKQVNLNQF